jgi:glycylpeptide N-tetradecanoyltransferase
MSNDNEPIEADKAGSELRQEPYSLPAGFNWDMLDINDPLVVSLITYRYAV